MKNTFFVSIALLLILGLSSCLKSNSNINLSDIPNYKLIEIAPSEDQALGAADRVYSFVLGTSTSVKTFKIPIYLNSSTGLFSKDVTVQLANDTAAIDEYNSADTSGNTNYQFLPDSVFATTTPLTVVIPAGQKFGYLVVNINTPLIDKNTQYMLSYKIVGVPSGTAISETRASAQFIIASNNVWDGLYMMKGYTLRAGDDSRTGYFSGVTRGLVTSDLTSVYFDDLAVWSDGTGIGIGAPTLTINKDNSVKITSPSGAYNDPSYTSHYDPDTKTFYISFTWGAGPSSRLSTDTLVYLGPR